MTDRMIPDGYALALFFLVAIAPLWVVMLGFLLVTMGAVIARRLA